MSDILERLKKAVAKDIEREVEKRITPVLEVMEKMLEELRTTNKLLRDIKRILEESRREKE